MCYIGFTDILPSRLDDKMMISWLTVLFLRKTLEMAQKKMKEEANARTALA